MNLRKLLSRAGTLIAGAALSLGLATTSMAATAPVSYVDAQLSPGISVVVDNTARTFYNVAGIEVHPIFYDGTTYLPIRAMAELIDKNVNWDQSTFTVSLSGTRTTPDTVGTPDYTTTTQMVNVRLSPDITVLMDGVSQRFTNASGGVVYPMLYNGSVYLPIRAIGNLMGFQVDWNGSTQTVGLTSSGSASGSLVTDADSFGPTTGGSTNTGMNTGSTGGYYPGGSTGSITAEQAKQIALNHAGLSSSQVTFIRAHLDWEYGRQVYDVEFFNVSNYTEYDYEIDAANGTVLSYDFDAEYYTPPASGNVGTGSALTRDQAIQLALSRVPGATTANVYELEMDYEHGRLEYEGTIFYNNTEYEFTVDATNGVIREWDVESHRGWW